MTKPTVYRKMYLISLIWILVFAETTLETLVSTAQGMVRGVGRDGYTSFVGIPYACANRTGRFKRAGPAPFWTDIREPSDPHCMSSSAVDSCLQLDIHVPSFDGSPWPVLVWVKGSSGVYHPSMLVRKGLIVIIVRHRLGALGFLCTEYEQIPGNGGIKDVVLALRWIKDNIVAFRGNPHRVVVGGGSFGAAMVETLILSPMARGLYEGAIMQSGTALSPWAFNYDALVRAKVLKEAYNNPDNFPLMLLDENLDELGSKSIKLDVPYLPFGICVESSFYKEERLLAEAPYDILSNGKAASVPLLIGYNNEEAYIFASILKNDKIIKKLPNDMAVLIPTELKEINAREINRTRERIKQIYFKNNNFTLSSLLPYYTDAYFKNHIHRSARLHSSFSDSPVYYYQFSYSGDTGVEPENGVEKHGAAHSDELAYLFPENGRRLTNGDGKVQENLITLWTNFVKYLNPTPHPEESVRWEPLDHRQPKILNIGLNIEMINYPYTSESDVWDDIYEKYYTRKRNIGT